MSKKILLILALFASVSARSQWYYAAEVGVFTGTTSVYNYNTAKTERLSYSGLFFDMPIGVKNAYNVLFEGSLGYNGTLSTSASVGYQLGHDAVNFQILAGGADYISLQKHFKTTHEFNYKETVRFNYKGFFAQFHMIGKTAYPGIGFKAYIYE